VHARYTGTGHADTTKYEWATHHHRDTLASIVGHPPLLSYVALADGESQARERFEVIEVSREFWGMERAVEKGRGGGRGELWLTISAYAPALWSAAGQD
jgi:hypothetical protein